MIYAAFVMRQKAHNTLAEAIRRGRVKRQPCRDCGALDVEGHHPDYRKPIEVIWLCRKHHRAEHRRLRLAGIEILGREQTESPEQLSPVLQEIFYTRGDVLRILGNPHPATLERWKRKGLAPPQTVLPGRRIVFFHDSFWQWMRDREPKPKQRKRA